jgi:hypothetical protein
MHRSLIFLTAAILAAAAEPAAAAGPFDGKWIADIPAQGKCNGTSTLTIVVADGTIQGQVHNPANVRAMTGHVDADGNGTFTVAKMDGTIKFSGNHFDATWFNGTCDRHAEGDRAPDSAQQAAAAAQRKDHQAAYADMVARAEAGEKIDYTRLRAEYVYSENWDFYGNKINGLMQQADAAAKGKDCTSALDKATDVTKLDFTVAQAHTIKSDCLEDDRAKSHIESNIADGLDDSLMHSGDGDSEKTAYVVGTLHEELRALYKRHIQIKARQTEVHGSDGHYYDEVQGISIRSGFGAYSTTSVSVKTVYFNVDSFVTGRDSKRAAVAQAEAALH